MFIWILSFYLRFIYFSKVNYESNDIFNLSSFSSSTRILDFLSWNSWSKFTYCYKTVGEFKRQLNTILIFVESVHHKFLMAWSLDLVCRSEIKSMFFVWAVFLKCCPQPLRCKLQASNVVFGLWTIYTVEWS